MKNYLIILFCLFSFSVIEAQEIERSVIGTSGTSVANATAQMDYTIGEVVILTTTNTADPHVTQGFNQTGTSISVDIHEPNIDLGISIFPNPVASILNIETELNGANDVRYFIVNAVGQTTHEGAVTANKTVLNLSELAAANYFLVVISPENEFRKTIQFVKR